MNEIKRAKYNDQLIRATGQDVGPPAPFLGGEVVPVFPVEEQTLDMQWLKGIKSFRARTSVTGGGAAVPAFRLTNPVGSGVVLIVERFSVLSTTAQTVTWGLIFPSSPLAGPLSAIGCDTRVGSVAPGRPAAGAGKPSSDSAQIAANFAFAMWGIAAVANENYSFDEELVLTAGWSLDIYGNTVATTCWFNCRWRERSIDDLELNA